MSRRPWQAQLILVAVAVASSAPITSLANSSKDGIVDKTTKGKLELISLSSSGDQGSKESGTACVRDQDATMNLNRGFGGWDGATMSDDGRFVAFTSLSSLATEDGNGPITDVYLRDRRLGTTTLVSKTRLGLAAQAPTLPLICAVGSSDPAISGNGKFIAFVSRMPLLDDEPPIAGSIPESVFFKVYVLNRITGNVERVSKGWDGSLPNEDSGHEGVSISHDGRIVTFISEANNLIKDAPCDSPPCQWQAYSYDRRTGKTTLLSSSPDGGPGDGVSRNVSVSDDGRTAVFESRAGNLIPGDTHLCPNVESTLLVSSCADVFVRDLRRDKLSLVTKTRDGAWGPLGSGLYSDGGHGQAISADGRFVLFWTNIPDMVPAGGGGVFVRDLHTGDIQRVSVNSYGELGGSSWASISDDGRYVLAHGDAGGISIDGGVHGHFMYNLITGQTDNLKTREAGTAGLDLSISISPSGRYYLFVTENDTYVEGDDNGAYDVFLRDLGPQGLSTLLEEDSEWGNPPRGTGPRASSSMYINDPEGDVNQLVPGPGGDIVGGTAAYRPDLNDIYARIDVAKLQTAAGLSVSPILLGMKIVVGDHQSYEIRFEPDPSIDLLTPEAHLYRCDRSDCAQIASLKGSYGMVAESVVASLPLALIGVDSVSEITRISLFSALVEPGRILNVVDRAN